MMDNSFPVLNSIRDLSPAPKAWLCDIWGVLHNGVQAFAPAVQACKAFRASGGVVVLISNSPRPMAGVITQLQGFGIGRDCFDAVVTSGDVTRSLVAERTHLSFYHIGPERDLGFFEDLPVRYVPASSAEVIICTDLADNETETADDYDVLLRSFAARQVPMICGNPDLWVERGHRLLPCAGVLAERYARFGQEVLQAGKPFRPIYELAYKALPEGLDLTSVVAIGDGIDTDIKGAAGFGVSAVYVASRVHLREHATPGAAPAQVLNALFKQRPFKPVAALTGLSW